MTKDGPLLWVLLAVASGAAIGAVVRWWLSYELNARWGWMPWGTLAANLTGGLLIGLVLAWIESNPSIAPLLRLFLVTGFLGGLTTFSTFSAEAITFLMNGFYWRAMAHVLSHVVATFALTGIGFTLGRVWFH